LVQHIKNEQNISKVRSTPPSLESEFLFALSETHAAYFILSNAVLPNAMGQLSDLSRVASAEFFPHVHLVI
jgi:hypothetical protein